MKEKHITEYSYSNDTGDAKAVVYHLLPYLESCNCSPFDALQHVCGGMSHIVLRSSETAKKFFRELYEADFEQRLDYLRVKMPELFFRMKYSKTDSSYYDRNLVPRTQVAFVKNVSDYKVQHKH